jgi:hypothetical protein
VVSSIDVAGRTRNWQIFVRLIRVEGKVKQPARRKINWKLTEDTQVDINPRFLTPLDIVQGPPGGPVEPLTIPAGVIAQIWSEHGIVKPVKKATSRSVPSYVIKGKNIGKSNATNVFTQALINARSKHLGKQKGCASRYYPIAVHKISDKPRDPSKHIVYPVAIQRKLDGGRTVAYAGADGKAVLYSRKLKDIKGQVNIVKDLNTLFKKIKKTYPGAYLDGELYQHGLSLQQISGIMRRDAKSKTTARESSRGVQETQLGYHIFDIFFPEDAKLAKMPFIERKRVLDTIMAENKSPRLVLVKTYIANNEAESQLAYDTFLKEKYEGAIIRNLAGVYEFSAAREMRTYQVRKRKPRYSAEYKVIGYTEGSKGKDKGAIIWVLETDKQIQFTSTPVGIDYAERYRLFKLFRSKPAEFANNYKDKKMTVEYDDISTDGVPLRAKAKCLRVIA